MIVLMEYLYDIFTVLYYYSLLFNMATVWLAPTQWHYAPIIMWNTVCATLLFDLIPHLTLALSDEYMQDILHAPYILDSVLNQAPIRSYWL